MPLYTYNQQFPQLSALSGRNVRRPTTTEYKYGNPLSTLSTNGGINQVEVNPPVLDSPVTSQQNNPYIKPLSQSGVSSGPGLTGDIGADNSNAGGSNPVGDVIGANMAANMAGKGTMSGITTAVLGTLANAPTSVIGDFALQSMISSALAPVSLGNSIVGGVISGQMANNALSSMAQSGVPGHQAQSVAAAIAKGLPSTLTGHLFGLGKDQTPSEFAQSLMNATLDMNAQVPGGYISPGQPSNPANIDTSIANQAPQISAPFNPNAITVDEQHGIGPGGGEGQTVGGFNPGQSPSAPTGRADNPNAAAQGGLGSGGQGGTGLGAAAGSPTGEAGLTGASSGAGAGPGAK